MGQKQSKRKRKEVRHLVPFLDVDVYVEPDDRCSISGITCLNGGRIIATDYLGHLVKYYDIKMLKLLDHIQVESAPYEVCKSASDDVSVYVTLPFSKKVLCFEIQNDKLKLKSSIPIDGMCYGVTCHKNGLAVSVRTDKHDWQVELLDFSGTVLNVIKHDEFGKKLFGYPDYITMDTEGSRLYVSDGLKNTVTSLCLNNTTNLVFKINFVYKDKHLLTPKGITIDVNGDIYVIGCESNNVHKISKSGQKLGIVLDGHEEIVTPMGIFYEIDEKKIFVTEGSRKIMIFKEP